MAFNFKDTLDAMEDLGFFEIILPFILIFTLVFAVLQKTMLFGKESKKYNMVIALVIALLFLTASKLIEAVNKMLPVVAIILVAVLGLFMIMGFFGMKEGGPGTKFFGILVGGIAIALGIFYFVDSSGDIFRNINRFLQPHWTPIILVGIMIAVIALVAASGSKKETSSEK